MGDGYHKEHEDLLQVSTGLGTCSESLDRRLCQLRSGRASTLGKITGELK